MRAGALTSAPVPFEASICEAVRMILKMTLAAAADLALSGTWPRRGRRALQRGSCCRRVY